jgi:hypothetical protein
VDLKVEGLGIYWLIECDSNVLAKNVRVLLSLRVGKATGRIISCILVLLKN